MSHQLFCADPARSIPPAKNYKAPCECPPGRAAGRSAPARESDHRLEQLNHIVATVVLNSWPARVGVRSLGEQFEGGRDARIQRRRLPVKPHPSVTASSDRSELQTQCFGIVFVADLN